MARPRTLTSDKSSNSSSGSNRLFASAAALNSEAMGRTDWALFVAVSLVWGASFLLIAVSLEAFTPATVTFGRVAFGAVTLGIVRAIQARRPQGSRSGTSSTIDRNDWPRVALLALLWVAIPFSLYPIAQQWINSAVAGLINGAVPIMVTVVSVLLVRVAPKPIQLAGLAIGFVGTLLISIGAAAAGPSQARGVALALAATLCYGFAINIANPLQARYGAIQLMSNVLGLATLMVTPLMLLNLGDNSFALGPAAALSFLGVIGTGLAYWMMATLVGRVGSIRASFITYMIPVVSLILGIAVRGDSISALALIGMPATIAGAALAGARPSRRKRSNHRSAHDTGSS